MRSLDLVRAKIGSAYLDNDDDSRHNQQNDGMVLEQFSNFPVAALHPSHHSIASLNDYSYMGDVDLFYRIRL